MGLILQGDVWRVAWPQGERVMLVVSGTEANAVRRVVIACDLQRHDPKESLGQPTTVSLGKDDLSLDEDRICVASPMTIPKGSLVRREGRLKPQRWSDVDAALDLAFGRRPWPL